MQRNPNENNVNVIDQPYVHYALPLTTDEKTAFSNVIINDTSQFSMYGQLELLLDQLVDWFKANITCPTSSVEVISQAVVKITNHILRELEAETGYVILRSTHMPHDTFNTPRWHIDGRYFDDEKKECQKKVVMALCGVGTLFYKGDKTDRDTLKKYPDERKKLAEEFADPGKVDSTPEHHGSIFLAGSDDLGGIHSEPPIHKPRLFMSIVPGARTQIEDIKKRDEMITPIFQTSFDCFFARTSAKDEGSARIEIAGKCAGIVLEYLQPKI